MDWDLAKITISHEIIGVASNWHRAVPKCIVGVEYPPSLDERNAQNGPYIDVCL